MGALVADDIVSYEILATGEDNKHWSIPEVSVDVVEPIVCHPFGDEKVSAGFVKVVYPSVTSCTVGSTAT